jgi:hypothetical protein
MYWQRNNVKLATLTIPMLTMGEDFDSSLTLVTEAGEDLENVCLCCLNGADAGLIQAKKSTDTTYREVCGLLNSECFLGHIAASSETVIDFRVNFPVGTTAGVRMIPVKLFYGDLIEGPTTLWQVNLAPLWSDFETIEFWQDFRTN